MEKPKPAQLPSATSFEKDLEIQSPTPPSSSLQLKSDIDKEERGEEEDFEAEEEGSDQNDPHGDGYGGRGEGSVLGTGVTKTSTKSSWKDPGPPPDGGLVAWTQGAFRLFCSENIGMWTGKSCSSLGISNESPEW